MNKPTTNGGEDPFEKFIKNLSSLNDLPQAPKAAEEPTPARLEPSYQFSLIKTPDGHAHFSLSGCIGPDQQDWSVLDILADFAQKMEGDAKIIEAQEEQENQNVVLSDHEGRIKELEAAESQRVRWIEEALGKDPAEVLTGWRKWIYLIFGF